MARIWTSARPSHVPRNVDSFFSADSEKKRLFECIDQELFALPENKYLEMWKSIKKALPPTKIGKNRHCMTPKLHFSRVGKMKVKIHWDVINLWTALVSYRAQLISHCWGTSSKLKALISFVRLFPAPDFWFASYIDPIEPSSSTPTSPIYNVSIGPFKSAFCWYFQLHTLEMWQILFDHWIPFISFRP